MLKSLSVSNYKAFREANIELKPITILLGENSVGKSSLLQLLLLLKQTAQYSVFGESFPLKMYGYFAKMGLPENLFHNKDISTPFGFTIKFTNDKLTKYISDLFKEYVKAITNIVYFLPIKGLFEWRNAHKYGVTSRSSFSELVKLLVEVLSKEKLDTYKLNLDYAISREGLIAGWDIQNLSTENFMSIYDMLNSIKEIVKDNDEYSISFKFGFVNKKLSIQAISIDIKSNNILSCEKTGSIINVLSDITDFSELQQKGISNSFISNSSIFNCFTSYREKNKYETTKSNFMLRLIGLILKEFREEFLYTKLNHIGPLRASPKRYYVLDKESYSTYLDCSDGEAVVELLKNVYFVRAKTNEWLSRFGFNVNITESEDVINHLLVNQNTIDYDITDVGFGVSQILPIIVQGYWASKDSLTIVEQPEIHLHPQMQAELANLFSDIVSYKDRNLIIETHSEYMLRRLRRLMSDPSFGDIKPKDVALYYFEGMDLKKSKDYVSVHSIDISDSGSFEWPKSFYETELIDNIEFMKNQQQ